MKTRNHDQITRDSARTSVPFSGGAKGALVVKYGPGSTEAG